MDESSINMFYPTNVEVKTFLERIRVTPIGIIKVIAERLLNLPTLL
ncbi:MAG: hypothetical protein QXV01_12025 [Candidatus Bathyarchaeia archaeon]